jgi:hypothetical protein
MKRQWQPEELIEHFIVLPDEQACYRPKLMQQHTTSLARAVLLKFFQYAARFPLHKNEVPKAVVTFIGNQLGIPYEQYLRYNWSGRTIKSHRTQIRAFLGFRTAIRQDEQELREWLLRHLLPLGSQFEQLKELVYQRLRAERIEPPTPEQVERLIHSAIHSFEKNFCAATLAKLSEETIAKIDALLNIDGAIVDEQVQLKPSDFNNMAEASLEHPEELVKDVVYLVVSRQTLQNLVKEYKSTGSAFEEKVYVVMRASYLGHYRCMVPQLLTTLEFRSNNDMHRWISSNKSTYGCILLNTSKVQPPAKTWSAPFYKNVYPSSVTLRKLK